MDFKNTIIILTSNLGSDIILEGITDNGEISEEARGMVDQLLKRSFRPEFLNRLDEIIYYKPLTKANIYGIVDLLVNDAAKDYMIDTAFDPQYGARPLKRFIQSNIETLVARKIIAEDPVPGTVITIDYDGTGLVAR